MEGKGMARKQVGITRNADFYPIFLVGLSSCLTGFGCLAPGAAFMCHEESAT